MCFDSVIKSNNYTELVIMTDEKFTAEYYKSKRREAENSREMKTTQSCDDDMFTKFMTQVDKVFTSTNENEVNIDITEGIPSHMFSADAELYWRKCSLRLCEKFKNNGFKCKGFRHVQDNHSFTYSNGVGYDYTSSSTTNMQLRISL